MIPKIIHYCWFGGNEKPEIVNRCIESWKKMCPDYEIIEWNESNFDIFTQEYVKEAYEHKKYAFVSDYVRLFALLKFGGVYIDSDCELLQPIDEFMNEDIAVTGYQEDVTIPAAIMFSNKDNKWIKLLLSYYKNKHFVDENGSMNMMTNSTIITVLSLQYCNFKIGDYCIPDYDVKLYDSIVFSPSAKRKKQGYDKNNTFDVDSKRTVCIQYGTASWATKNTKTKIKSFFINFIKRVFGLKIYKKIKSKILIKKMSKIELKIE